MTKRQKVDYALVEFRPNPARPSEGRLLLGAVFAFKSGDVAGIGWSLRAGIPQIEVEKLDSLTREIFEHRESTLKAEIDAAVQGAETPADVLQVLAANNPWAFHIRIPVQTEVDQFDPKKMGLEDWVGSWSGRLFQENVDETAGELPRPGTKRSKAKAPPVLSRPPWMERPRVITQVSREPAPV